MTALFTEQHKITRGTDAVSDTTSETTTAVVDMEGFDEVTFVVDFADVDAAAVLTFAVKENTASSTSSPSPTAVAVTSVSAGVITSGNLVVTEDSGNLDNKQVVVNVAKGQFSKRYAFLSITATTESYELNAITIIQSRARDLPVTQPADVVALAQGAS